MKLRTTIAAAALAAGTTAGLLTAPAQADTIINGINVGGRIEAAYWAAGGQSKFGGPTTGELNAGRWGKFQVFERDASIYWQPDVDGGRAHQVGGAIRDKWGSLGWENGVLGYPTSHEVTIRNLLRGVGAVNTFEGGAIYWSPTTGVHTVWGAIRDIWNQNQSEGGMYGYPTSDEYQTPDGKFRQDFQSGFIVWPG